jgi:hypothetical protein
MASASPREVPGHAVSRRHAVMQRTSSKLGMAARLGRIRLRRPRTKPMPIVPLAAICVRRGGTQELSESGRFAPRPASHVESGNARPRPTKGPTRSGSKAVRRSAKARSDRSQGA